MYVYYPLLLFSFLIPLSKAAISFFVFYFFVLMLYEKGYKAVFETLKYNRTFAYAGAFLIYMYAAILWSEDIKEAFDQARLYGYWLLVLPAMAVLIKKEWLPNMLNAFLFGMFTSEILAYGMFFEFWSINGRDASYPTPFMTHIHYSVFLAFTATVLLGRVLSRELTLYAKIPYAFFFLISTANLMFSTGRTGQLAFFVSLIVLMFLKYRASLKSISMGLLSVTIIFFLAYNTFDIFKKRVNMGITDINAISKQDYNDSFGTRVAYWFVAGEVLREKPLLGEGLGDYKLAVKESLDKNDLGLSDYTKEFMFEHHFHNQYLMVAVQGGILGLSLMILLLYKLFRLRIEDTQLKEVSISGLTVVSVGFIAEPLWMLQFPLTLFLFIVSLSIAASKKRELI